jgi:uncharacterized SAM-binding protein YcdF (DUF218 family)
MQSISLFAGAWTTLSWGITDLLIMPQAVIPVLFMLVALPLFFRAKHWKNWVGKPAAIALISYLLLISPVAAKLLSWGLDNQFISQWYDSRITGKSIDAIVILGRGDVLASSRIKLATQLAKSDPVPIIFASGQTDAPYFIERLKGEDISTERLQGEGCSQTTEENALFTAALLYPQGVRRIMLITDPMHMPRSVMTLQSFGLEVVPHSSPIPWNLTSAEQSFLALREYFGLIGYGVRGRFQSRPPLENLPELVLKRIEEWNCKVKV